VENGHTSTCPAEHGMPPPRCYQYQAVILSKTFDVLTATKSCTLTSTSKLDKALPCRTCAGCRSVA
jgi:hypothetical protein